MCPGGFSSKASAADSPAGTRSRTAGPQVASGPGRQDGFPASPTVEGGFKAQCPAGRVSSACLRVIYVRVTLGPGPLPRRWAATAQRGAVERRPRCWPRPRALGAAPGRPLPSTGGRGIWGAAGEQGGPRSHGTALRGEVQPLDPGVQRPRGPRNVPCARWGWGCSDVHFSKQ